MKRIGSLLALTGTALLAPISTADTLDSVRQSITGSIPLETGSDADSGIYLSVSAGANFVDDVDIKNVPLGNNFFVIENGEISFDPGMNLEIGIGIPISQSLAIEVSTGLAYNSVESVSGTWNGGANGISAVTGGDGHAYQVPLVAELVFTVYDNNTMQVNIHGGGGLQWTNSDISNVYSTAFGPGPANASISGSAFAFRYQFGIDCLFKIESNVSLGASLGYSGTTESNFGRATFTSNVPGVSLYGTEDVKTGSIANLTLGINLKIEF